MLILCNYYVTYRCNAFCEFCHFGDHTNFKDSPYADLNDFKSNVEQLAKLGVKFIDLTGGEPLLHKEIHDMAEFAHNLKMQTSITTNTLLYPKFAEKLAGKINLLHFSLDSPDEEEHNRIRKVDCYNAIFKSIEIAKSLGEFPDILFTVTNETYRKLPRMHELAAKHDLVLLVNPVFSYFGNPGLAQEAVDYVDEYCDGKMDIYLNKAFMKLRRDGGNDKNNPSCKAVSRVIVISPDNDIILPCYHFSNDKIKIDKPIAEIRKSDKIKYFIKNEGRFDFCQGCTVNCYFEPSFAFPTNLYAISSLTSKFKIQLQQAYQTKNQKETYLKVRKQLMRFTLVLIIIYLIRIDSLAQTTAQWFPADLNIQPFTAHFLEPKVGFQYLFDLEKVRIDIGTSHDIIHWKTEDESFSFGADFFTYTRARSENNFKFPVETVDYLFGVNGSYKSKSELSEWGARLRFSHISAHLVDGYYEAESESWLNGREPFVYSREFFELIAYYKIYGVRVYGGVTYNIHIVPDEIKKGMLQVGFDYYATQIRNSLFTPFIAYGSKLTAIEEYSGNSIISAGIKFGQAESRGFSILASYFSGKSVHGEFYNVNESYAAIGINLDI